MTSSYTSLADTVGHMIAAPMLEHEASWEGSESPDRRVFWVLMAAGLVAVREVLAGLGARYEAELRGLGFFGERRETVTFRTLFGWTEVVSAYLRKDGETEGARPRRDRLGIEGGGMSLAVERALTDFGVDQSFGKASAKFEEHHGSAVHRTTARRTVFRVAGRASAFIASKLETAPEETPICVMVQADGANMPVATLERLEGQTTPTGRPKIKKACFYREARLGRV